MEREAGYYWVRFADRQDWEPAELDDGGNWYVIGADVPFDAEAFAEISDMIER